MEKRKDIQEEDKKLSRKREGVFTPFIPSSPFRGPTLKGKITTENAYIKIIPLEYDNFEVVKELKLQDREMRRFREVFC